MGARERSKLYNGCHLSLNSTRSFQFYFRINTNIAEHTENTCRAPPPPPDCFSAGPLSLLLLHNGDDSLTYQYMTVCIHLYPLTEIVMG